MKQLLVALGRFLGLAGIVICVIAIVARGAGFFWIGNVTSGALLQGGVAVIIISVLCFTAK